MSDMKLKPLAAAVGLAFAGALAMSAMAVADAEDQLCPAEALERGYDLLADNHDDGDTGGDDGAGDDGGDAGDDAGDAGDDAGDAGDDAGDDGDDAGDDGA